MSTSVQGETMDLDLNQDPSSGSEISPWSNELDTTHSRIQESGNEKHQQHQYMLSATRESVEEK